MKFTKKELTGIVKICDAVSKMKDKQWSLEEARKKVNTIWGKVAKIKEIQKGNEILFDGGPGSGIVAKYNTITKQLQVF